MPETFEQFVARVNAYGYLPTTNKGVEAMAKQVKLPKGKEFTFSSGAGQASKYPWDEWFNGSLIMIERSVFAGDGETVTEKRDFDVERDAMPGKLKSAARRKYKVVQISKRDADGKKLVDALILKARDMTPEERQAEDILRAEERAARKAEKEAAAGTAATQQTQEVTQAAS